MIINNKKQSGFTIIELMIAISILSILLLASAVVMLNIGSLYAKGVDATTVQNDSRNVIQSIASSIQFNYLSGSQINSGSQRYYSSTGTLYTVYAYCIGYTRYSYIIGFPDNSNTFAHTIWKDTMRYQGACKPLNILIPTPNCIGSSKCIASATGSGSDLTNSNMHLASLSINSNPNYPQLYSISIGLAYGLKDMFNVNSSGTLVTTDGNYVCGNRTSERYCATSSLETTVVQRIN